MIAAEKPSPRRDPGLVFHVVALPLGGLNWRGIAVEPVSVTQTGVGHFGLLHGPVWRSLIMPQVRAFIREMA